MDDRQKRNAASQERDGASGDFVQARTSGTYPQSPDGATRTSTATGQARFVFQWLEQVRRDQAHGLSRLDASVAAELANHLNARSAYARPGKERLAAALKVEPRSIRRSIQRLAAAGHLVIERGGRGPRDTNRYRPVLIAATVFGTGTAESPLGPRRETVESPLDAAKGDSTVRKGGPASPPNHLKEPLKTQGVLWPGDPSHPDGKPAACRRPAEPLPVTWHPSAAHVELGASLGLSRERVLFEAGKMRDWADFNGVRGVNWNARFNLWLKREARPAAQPAAVRQSAMDVAVDALARRRGMLQ